MYWIVSLGFPEQSLRQSLNASGPLEDTIPGLREQGEGSKQIGVVAEQDTSKHS